MITVWLATIIRDGEVLAEFIADSEQEAQRHGDEWLANDDATIDFLRERPWDIDDRSQENRWLLADAASEAGCDYFVRSIMTVESITGMTLGEVE